MKNLDIIAAVLLIVGGLNWGLVGIANFDLVATIFGSTSFLSSVVYSLVGIAALYSLFSFRAARQRAAASA